VAGTCEYGNELSGSINFRICQSSTDDLNNTGDDSLAQRLFRTVALLDDGPVRAETCSSFVN
jgi:hypothetical protein